MRYASKCAELILLVFKVWSDSQMRRAEMRAKKFTHAAVKPVRRSEGPVVRNHIEQYLEPDAWVPLVQAKQESAIQSIKFVYRERNNASATKSV